VSRLIFFFACLFLAVPCGARIITVDNDGPADFNNIQAAIDDSNDSDIIVVKPGIYTGDGNTDIDFGGRAITVRSTDPNDPNTVESTVIDCNGSETEPHRAFYFHNQEGPNSVLSGLTITNGWALLTGGGIYCEADLFQYNNPTFTKCIITHNTAKEGGGIGCKRRSSPYINNCVISENLATDGSGGGILYCNYAGCNGFISNCNIINNQASVDGGGLSKCSTSINNSTIINNSAGVAGGGISYCNEVNNCVVSGNWAGENGGGIFGCETIGNCTISDNIANNGMGGGIFGNCDANLANSIMWGNMADQGNEIYLRTQLVCVAFPPYVIEETSTMTIAYSDIQGGQAEISVDPNSILYWKAGNIDTDPCFVKPGYWDPNGTPEDSNDDFWVDGDYHLKSEGWRWHQQRKVWTWDDVTSRCIDAGNPGSPLGDEPITIPDDPDNDWGENLRINMGAYGGTAEASVPPYDWAILADLTNDGTVNFVDFAHLVAMFADQGEQLYGDFNRDGGIDLADVAALAEDWLKTTTWHQ